MLQPTLIALGSILLSSVLIAPARAFAQQRGVAGGGPASARRETVLSRDKDLQTRANTLQLLSEPEKVKVVTEEDRKFIADQVFEDFERVQIINREMIQATSNLDNNSYKRISSLADEMNKRAKRLKTNLNIPDVEHDKKEPESQKEMDAAQLKASVKTLNGNVKSFVNSPVFKDPRVTTVGHLQNLRRDIINVIELSRTVKKAASKLQDQ
jgi:hypothetical protein